MLNDSAFTSLVDFLDRHQRIVTLTGAGISADAGIPTYRNREGIWLHSKPIQHSDFVKSDATRQRYWARSTIGWPVIRDTQPTRAHQGVALLESTGKIEQTITQNVDRLHQQAGNQRVIDLHGRLDRVICLDCDTGFDRERIQEWLLTNNPTLNAALNVRPDGDAEIPLELEQQFKVPPCPTCSGRLMPDVVFFGGSIPKARTNACMDSVREADALLAIGSSLQVFSGFRLCRLAKQLGKPIAILNPGKTRADDLADLTLRADCQQLLDPERLQYAF